MGVMGVWGIGRVWVMGGEGLIWNFWSRPVFFQFFAKKGLSPAGEKKSELLGQKIKNHLPAVILKFFITTPNLTSNFETHKNVGDNFFFVYK